MVTLQSFLKRTIILPLSQNVIIPCNQTLHSKNGELCHFSCYNEKSHYPMILPLVFRFCSKILFTCRVIGLLLFFELVSAIFIHKISFSPTVMLIWSSTKLPQLDNQVQWVLYSSKYSRNLIKLNCTFDL